MREVYVVDIKTGLVLKGKLQLKRGNNCVVKDLEGASYSTAIVPAGLVFDTETEAVEYLEKEVV